MIEHANLNPLLSFQLPVEHGLTRQSNTPSYLLDPALIVAHRASSPELCHYRQAAANLFPADLSESTLPSRSSSSRIFVTSPHQGDGKTSTAFNLAWTLAQSDKTVLLAELNFVRPRLCAALGDLHLRYGLEGALRGTAIPADAVFSLNSTSLHIAAVRNATALDNLAPIQANLNAFLQWSSENFDLLVIDCPSVLSREWNLWFRNNANPALLVTREDHTPNLEVQRAVKTLGPSLTGVLVNAARHIPAQLPAHPQPGRISPAEELSFLQTEHLKVATASERKI